ncbi:MAG: DHH family phosphoesterase [Deltaproteobacteria bacterium]
MSDSQQIIALIGRGGRFCIASHENPDGDAIGSTLALGLALRQLGKEVLLYNRDSVPDYLRFLAQSSEITNSLAGAPFDATFIVDCPHAGRVGVEFERFVKSGVGGATVIIDHHESSRPASDFRILDTAASSTGMLIYSLIKTLGTQITPDIAASLYTTISGDTGSFKYSNTYAETFRAAAELVEAGADPSQISEAVYENEPLSRLKLLGLVLPTLEISCGGRVSSIVITQGMFRETGATREDTEGFVNFPRSIRGVEVAALFREEEPGENGDRWKISLRAKGALNVAGIAETFGGGGHKNAAGCTISGGLAHVKSAVLRAVEEGISKEVA